MLLLYQIVVLLWFINWTLELAVVVAVVAVVVVVVVVMEWWW